MASKTPATIFAACIAFTTPVYTQNNYFDVITSAVPFLRAHVDARSGGMGDAGVALLNDANAIYINASKNIFNADSIGFAFNNKNFIDELVGSYYLTGSGFYKINDKNVVSAGFRYINLTGLIWTGTPVINDFKPYEYAIDANYSRKLSDHFAAGITAKYIFSNLPTAQYVNGVEIKPSNGIAADISLFYTNDFKSGNKNSNIGFGMNISNIGNKITYTSSIEKDLIPTNLGLGAAYGIELNNYNKLTIAVDFNKLLLPTPDTTDSNANGIPDYKEKSVLSGIFGSFSDAPGGFEEELHEITLSTGLEYNFDTQLFVRGGYFYEHPTKGGRQYFTTGAGISYWKFQFDAAYLIPANNTQNSPDPAFTFTLSANI